MPVSLSIKNVPDDLLGLLRDRARVNHRSIQGELMSIIETALRPKIADDAKAVVRVAE